MRFDVLTQNELYAFSSLDPKNFMLDELFPLTDAYGMYDDEKPIGLMLMSHNKDRMVITWMMVDKDYREQSIGDFFLAAAFVEARDRGISQVIAYLSDRNIEKKDRPDIEVYLREHLFKEEKEVPAEKGGGKLLIANAGDFNSELTLADMIEEIL